MAKHLNKVIDIENNTLAILHIEDMFVILQCVFHGIRLLRLRRIGCRETTNFFLPSPVLLFRPLPGLSGNLVGISINLCKSIQKELFINDTP